MLLIADAGSTKTEWFYDGKTFVTQGINPFQQSEEVIASILAELEGLCPQKIRFYGAGCTPEKALIVRRLLAERFAAADIEVYSDLLAAAHALCGHGKGVACILGTGSNSCLYDGEKIGQNTPAGGYILGDEGGGAVLGKLFVNALLKGRLDKSVVDDFTTYYCQTCFPNADSPTADLKLILADIIERVYRRPLANRFLASLSVFVGKHRDNAAVRSLIKQNFAAFLDNNIKPYKHNEIAFTGSIAYHYADILRETAEEKGYSIKKITKSPMAELVKFYTVGTSPLTP